MNKISLGLILISCLLPLSLNEARGKPSAAALTAVQQDSTVVSVFKRIEKGILEVDVKIFFDFLSSVSSKCAELASWTPPTFCNAIRIGVKTEGKIRPVKIRFESNASRNLFLFYANEP